MPVRPWLPSDIAGLASFINVPDTGTHSYWPFPAVERVADASGNSRDLYALTVGASADYSADDGGILRNNPTGNSRDQYQIDAMPSFSGGVTIISAWNRRGTDRNIWLDASGQGFRVRVNRDNNTAKVRASSLGTDVFQTQAVPGPDGLNILGLSVPSGGATSGSRFYVDGADDALVSDVGTFEDLSGSVLRTYLHEEPVGSSDECGIMVVYSRQLTTLEAQKVNGFIAAVHGLALHGSNPYNGITPLYGTTIDQGTTYQWQGLSAGTPASLPLSASLDSQHSATWRIISGPGDLTTDGDQNELATLDYTPSAGGSQFIVVGVQADDGSDEETITITATAASETAQFGMTPIDLVTNAYGVQPSIPCATNAGLSKAVGRSCPPAIEGQYGDQYNDQYN